MPRLLCVEYHLLKIETQISTIGAYVETIAIDPQHFDIHRLALVEMFTIAAQSIAMIYIHVRNDIVLLRN